MAPHPDSGSHVHFSHTAPPFPAGQLQVNSFPSSSQVPPCRQGWESQGRAGFLVAGGWRVGFLRVVAGMVAVGLLVVTGAAILLLGFPMVSGCRTWVVVAVVNLRVVAGAMVVAVVVVVVVVKSLGIQSGTQHGAHSRGAQKPNAPLREVGHPGLIPGDEERYLGARTAGFSSWLWGGGAS